MKILISALNLLLAYVSLQRSIVAFVVRPTPSSKINPMVTGKSTRLYDSERPESPSEAINHDNNQMDLHNALEQRLQERRVIGFSSCFPQ
jgi:hypothetical protein